MLFEQSLGKQGLGGADSALKQGSEVAKWYKASPRLRESFFKAP